MNYEFSSAAKQVAIRLFLTCWIIYSLHVATNTVREIYLALAIADHFSFRVDEYANLHPDLFEKPGYGWHIENNPGASMFGAIPYALLRPVTDRVISAVNRSRSASGVTEPPEYASPWPMARDFYKRSWRLGYDVKFGIAAIVMQVLCMAPLSALGVVAMFKLLRYLSGSDRTALWLALLYAFGTPVFYRTGFINQNLMVTHVTFAAFLAIWNPEALLSPLRHLLIGIAGGAALLLDYTGVISLVWLFAYVLAKTAERTSARQAARQGAWYILGALSPVLLLFFYQYMSFGHPLYPAQHWMPNQNEYIHQGYRGLSAPQLSLAWAICWDYRFGLFASCPLLLLGVIGFAINRHWLPKLELAALFSFVFIMLLFFSSLRYSWMQYNTGIRYLVPVVPLLFVIAAGLLIRMPFTLAGLLSVASVALAWCMAMYRDVERGLGIVESVLHVFAGGFQLPALTVLSKITQFREYFGNGVSPLPLFALAAALVFIIWRPKVTSGSKHSWMLGPAECRDRTNREPGHRHESAGVPKVLSS